MTATKGARSAPPLFLDFETFYEPGGDYQLGNMTTLQYLRDARFELLGMGMAYGDGPAIWCRPNAVEAVLAANTRRPWVAHNAAFDGALAMQQWGLRPRLWLDTRLMATYAIAQGLLPPDVGVSLAGLAEHYGLEPKGDTAAAVAAGGDELAEYGKHDIVLTRQVFQRLLPLVPAHELALIDLHVRMGTEPELLLDRELLEAARLEDQPDPRLAPVLRSGPKFAELLRKLGVEPQTKVSERTGKETWAFAKTDAFMQSLHVHEDPRVRAVAAERAKATSNIQRSRAQRFLDTGVPFPAPVRYYGAHTGRGGGADGLNIQNLPRGGKLRQALQAPPGRKLVIVDSSQLEVRVLAELARDPALREPFAAGRDVYREFAALLFGTTYDEVTREQRDLAKPPVLAAGFGMGRGGMVAYAQQMGLAMDPSLAGQAVDTYRSRYRRVVAYWDECMDEIRRTGQQRMPGGRVITYPDLRNEGRDVVYYRPLIFSEGRKRRQLVRLWHGLAVENVVQGTGAEVIQWQMLQLARRWRVLFQVHDEVVLLVPDAAVPDAEADALETFRTSPPWLPGILLDAEVEVADHYT